jgi:multiple sugar transport system substrate-binding protein
MLSFRRGVALAAAVALFAGACSGATSPSATPAASQADASAPSTVAPTSQVTTPAPSEAADPVTITYYTFSAAPDHLKDLDSIVQAFQQKHPNITVKVQTAAYTDYFTKLKTSIGGGAAPDTFELNYENFVTFAAAGSLLDLGSVSKDDPSFNAATFYPRAYEVFQSGGMQYGLPETFSNVVLFYNKALFDAKGVAYPTADWTWTDERAAALKLTDASAGVWGDFQPVSFYEFYKALAQNGGSFLNADKTQATFNDAKGVEAANWLIGKVKTTMPDNAFGPDQDTALFKAGKLAMWHTGIWLFAALKDAPASWDIAVEPGNTQKGSAFFSNAVVASAGTAHPQEAWQWLQFLTSSPEAVKVRLDASWELPAVSDTSLFSSYLSQTPPANRQAVFDSLDAVVVPPVIEQQQAMVDAVNHALERARLGQQTVQAALDQAVTEVDALLK